MDVRQQEHMMRKRAKPNFLEKHEDRFLCLDCKEDTMEMGENYPLKDEVWLKAHPASRGRLCIGCVEERLGRHLVPQDFQGGPLDIHLINGPALSKRLMSRVGGPQNHLMRIHRELGLVYFDHHKTDEVYV